MSNCPVCHKSLSITLSICPGCGAMMNDSVREELGSNLVRKVNKSESLKPASGISPPVRGNTETAEFLQRETCRTLINFKTDEAQLPEWRLELRNSVRQRLSSRETNDGVPTQPCRPMTRTHEKFQQNDEPFVILPHPQSKTTVNLDNVIQRIEESRRCFQIEPIKSKINNITTSAKEDKTMIACCCCCCSPHTDLRRIGDASKQSTQTRAQNYSAAPVAFQKKTRACPTGSNHPFVG